MFFLAMFFFWREQNASDDYMYLVFDIYLLLKYANCFFLLTVGAVTCFHSLNFAYFCFCI